MSRNPDEAFLAVYSVLTDIRGELGEVRVSTAIQVEKMTNVAKCLDGIDKRVGIVESKLYEFEALKNRGQGGTKVVGWLIGGVASVTALATWAFDRLHK